MHRILFVFYLFGFNALLGAAEHYYSDSDSDHYGYEVTYEVWTINPLGQRKYISSFCFATHLRLDIAILKRILLQHMYSLYWSRLETLRREIDHLQQMSELDEEKQASLQWKVNEYTSIQSTKISSRNFDMCFLGCWIRDDSKRLIAWLREKQLLNLITKAPMKIFFLSE